MNRLANTARIVYFNSLLRNGMTKFNPGGIVGSTLLYRLIFTKDVGPAMKCPICSKGCRWVGRIINPYTNRVHTYGGMVLRMVFTQMDW